MDNSEPASTEVATRQSEHAELVLQSLLTTETVELTLVQIMKRISRRAIFPALLQAADSIGQMMKVYFISQAGEKELATSIVMFATFDWALIFKYSLSPATALLSATIGEVIKELEHDDFVDGNVSRLNRKIGSIQQQVRFGVLILSAAPCCVLFFFTEMLLKHMGVVDNIAESVAVFAKMGAFAVPGMMLRFVEYNFLCSIGKEQIMSAAMMFDIIFSVTLTALLVPGYGNLPQLGVRGSGIVLLVQSIITPCLLILYQAFSPSFKKYELFKMSNGWDLTHLKVILALGAPSMFTSGLASLSEFFRGILVGNLGQSALAISQTYISYSYVVTSFVWMFSLIGGVEVGEQLGEGDFVGMRKVGLTSPLLSFLLVVPALILTGCFAHSLSSLFLDQETIKDNGPLITGIFFLVFVSNAFYGVQNSLNESLKNVKDTAFSAAVTITSYLAFGLILSYITVRTTNLGLFGIEASYCLSFTCNALSFYLYWMKVANESVQNNVAPISSNYYLENLESQYCSFFSFCNTSSTGEFSAISADEAMEQANEFTPEDCQYQYIG